MIVSVSRLRCSYCHDLAVGTLEGCVCGTVLHFECWFELGQCPTLGCCGLRAECSEADPFGGAETARRSRRFCGRVLGVICFILLLGSASCALTVRLLSS